MIAARLLALRTLFTAALCLSGICHAASPTAATNEQSINLVSTYELARSRYEQGQSLRESSPAKAQECFAESAAIYRSLIESDSRRTLGRSADTLADAAGAAFMAGDLGRAVLYYRRAASLAPLNTEVRYWLSKSQEKAGASPMPIPKLERMASYMELVPLQTRSIVVLSTWCGCWLVLSARLFRTRHWHPRWLAISLGAMAFFTAATLVPREVLERRSGEAVVVAEVVPRLGPSDIDFAATRADPLKRGTSLQIVESRGEWSCITLNGSDRAWVKSLSLVRVFE